jgi:hypothetical protein
VHVKKDTDNSWMFLRFKTISDLDPLFIKNYQFGGQYLNIIKDDLLGSEKIFDKGLKYYPKNYDLNFNSGFLQAFELMNYDKAIKNYENVMMSSRAPAYLSSLLAKLKYSKTKDLKSTYLIISDMLINTSDEIIKQKLKRDLYSIKATIDLNCLNSPIKNSNCSKEDYEGNSYIKKGEVYFAPLNFNKYRLNN